MELSVLTTQASRGSVNVLIECAGTQIVMELDTSQWEIQNLHRSHFPNTLQRNIMNNMEGVGLRYIFVSTV